MGPLHRRGQMPRIVDPPGGLVVSANDRAYPANYPYPIAHGFDVGYRAYRIRQRLDELGRTTEAHMFALQLDTRAEPYRFYRDLVLELLSDDDVRDHPELEEIRDYVNAWEGDAEILTSGLPLLVEYRAELADAVLSPFLGACRDLEPDFAFVWAQVDVPLQRLLTERPPELNPDPGHHADWRAFLIDYLVRSAERLRNRFGVSMLGDLRWGPYQRGAAHPSVQRRVPVTRGLVGHAGHEYVRL
ncbi:MAG: penicillin acylase family protein [Methylotetracoccus sp.]